MLRLLKLIKIKVHVTETCFFTITLECLQIAKQRTKFLTHVPETKNINKALLQLNFKNVIKILKNIYQRKLINMIVYAHS